MRILRRLFRDARALAALLLLATLVAGELADARHHLSEQGCPADRGGSAGRDDNCVCASMHAAPLVSEAVAQPAPAEHECTFAAVAITAVPPVRTACAAAPRAPPRG